MTQRTRRAGLGAETASSCSLYPSQESVSEILDNPAAKWDADRPVLRLIIPFIGRRIIYPMIDQMIRPLYFHPGSDRTGGRHGLTKERLTSAHIRTLILKTLPTEYAAPVEEVIAFAVRSYKELDPEGNSFDLSGPGVPHPALSERPQSSRRTGICGRRGRVVAVPQPPLSAWKRSLPATQKRWRPARWPMPKSLWGAREEEAVYGWYLPESRDLAALKGEERFPMKVGTSRTGPYKRLKSTLGRRPLCPFSILSSRSMTAKNGSGRIHRN